MIDLTPITAPLMQIGALAATGIVAAYTPRAIAAFEKWTGVKLSEQQQSQLATAIQTGAGVIETKLDQGVMNLSHVNVSNPHIVQQAQAAMTLLGSVGQDLNLNTSQVANAIVAAVDTTAHPGLNPPVPNQGGQTLTSLLGANPAKAPDPALQTVGSSAGIPSTPRPLTGGPFISR